MSDYGSEFDATELNEDTLLATALDSLTESLPGVVKKTSVLPSVEFQEGEAEDEDEDEKDVVIHKPSRLRMSKRHRRGAEPLRRGLQSSLVQETLEVEYDERSRRAWSGALNPLRQL